MKKEFFVYYLCFFLFNSPFAFSHDLQDFESKLNLLRDLDVGSLLCRQTFSSFLSSMSFVIAPNQVNNAVVMRQELPPAMNVNQEDVLEKESQNLVTQIDQGKKWGRVSLLEKELKEWEAREVIGKLSREELKIPQGMKESEILEAQGFEEDHIRGIDEMSETITVTKQFRELNVNPYMYMDYFGDKMEERIRFMEEGVRNPIQKRMLELLREYGEKAIEEEGVSYEKWILFNIMLVEALGNDRFKIGQSTRDLVYEFPKTILLPTTEGIVGFITMSDGIDENIYVLGQTNKETINYDGVKGGPLYVMDHDSNHIRRIINGERRTNYSFHIKMKKVRKEIKKTPVEKRKDLEIVYWILRHEKPEIWGQTSMMKEEVMSELRLYYYRKKIKKSDPEVQRIVDDFMKIYNSV